jgi:mRNA interferase MazF
MVITQGDIFWASLSRSSTGSEPGSKRPVVVVQRDSINRSKFNTVVVVPLTKQTKHVNLPGNVLLRKGDANLPRQSLARTTHIMVIDKNRLIEKIGTLPKIKTKEIIINIMWVLGEEGHENGENGAYENGAR